ncbi:MAG: GTPase Era, partial [Kiritimatiellae bacterium]|nr:GTPase Era [Kiritimatiellia bacterium]
GEKVSIVSPVAQTTRNTVRGIVEDARGQLVLLDTPGLHKAVGRLGTLLNRMARRSAAGTDIACVVFDASQEPQLEDLGWMERVAHERPAKTVFVLNKADCKPFFGQMFRDAWQGDVKIEWLECSALDPQGAAKVADALYGLAEEGERLFDPDIVTDYPRKLAIADIIREKFLGRLHQELPHELGVLVKDIAETKGRWQVAADVLVARASQKPIVIGKSAAIIKAVRKAAEKELGETFGVKVALELWVRVAANWMEDKRLLTQMGYLGAEI